MNHRHHRQLIASCLVTAIAAGSVLLAVAPAALADDGSSAANRAANTVERATGTDNLALAKATSGGAGEATVSTAAGNVTVTAPTGSAGEVRTVAPDGSTLTVDLPNTKNVTGVKAGAGTIVYPDAAKNTDIAVQPTTDGGARSLVTLKDAGAPTEHRFTLNLPDGAELIANDQGGYDITKSSPQGGRFVMGQIDAPWAKDANGRTVPTSYKRDGNTLVQEVHTTKDTTFPVVADPKWTWGIITGTVYFDKDETISTAANSAFVAVLFAWAPPPFDVYGVLNAANISRVATIAAGKGQCVKIKVPTFAADQYSGGYCQ
ncbi:hypothetical protein SAMN05216371_0164 [Streptomyces sp. TLI_053]|uniref:hypothetical protein n=1 Tax=Streptomyces sp. TLI_053 TaxID=1855352 RepID=UPI00087C651D|nr:hypothetical protein [Streptomyces sp. TLI_053]SDS56116.1 hypothetical protein SAMN05216371_0164 [Streptomyces sp. TLI_053]